MDKTSSIVVLLGIISVATGLAAEFTRVKASEATVDVHGRCSYPSSPARRLGITSAATLLIAIIIIDVNTGCCRSNAVCLYIALWFIFLLAIGLLLNGIDQNESHDDPVVKNGHSSCYVVKSGVFAGGAVLAGLSCFIGIVYYGIRNSQENDAGSAQQEGIAMARPRFPVWSFAVWELRRSRGSSKIF